MFAWHFLSEQEILRSIAFHCFASHL